MKWIIVLKINKELFKACYGLIFFGVPNLGLRHIHLRTIAKYQPSEKLVDDLVVDKDSEVSPLLRELTKISTDAVNYSHVILLLSMSEKILIPSR